MRKRFRSRLSHRCCLLGVYTMVGFWIQGAAAQSAEEMMGVKEGHCSISQSTVDGRTFACMVWDHDPARFSDPTQIEIYRGHKKMYTIQSGSPIREWHFWHDGRQLAVHYGLTGELGTYALYDAQTGKQVDRLPGSLQPRMLPQWAKSPSQLAQESLPEGSAFSKQETLWITKVLNEVSTIRAGMSRNDLLKIFGEEGGLSTRTNRTYVYKECPYIKVDAVFSVVGASGLTESGEDKLISISRPYLAYSVKD
jgi:hypothetical protein